MIDFCFLLNQFPIIILATNTSIDSFVWNILLLLFIVGGIIGASLLYLVSRKPEDWKHESKTEGQYNFGHLKKLAESIKSSSVDEISDISVKKHIQNIFFEKLYCIRGISPEILMDLKTKDEVGLIQIIEDEEISDWILDVKKKKDKKDKTSKKAKYLRDINKILDKMEAWGE